MVAGAAAVTAEDEMGNDACVIEPAGCLHARAEEAAADGGAGYQRDLGGGGHLLLCKNLCLRPFASGLKDQAVDAVFTLPALCQTGAANDQERKCGGDLEEKTEGSACLHTSRKKDVGGFSGACSLHACWR